MTQKKLFVATPMYGGLCYGPFTEGLLGLQLECLKNNIEMTFRYLGNESLITRGRNLLVNVFLKDTDYTHFMFIDADIMFNPQDIIRMIGEDKDIIFGSYARKAINWENIENAVKAGVTKEHLQFCTCSPVLRFSEELRKENPDLTRPIPVDAGPTGFMLIKRNVFETLKEDRPEYIDHSNDVPKKVTIFFDTSLRDGEYLSEDYHFCFLWKDLYQGEVFWDPRVILNHIGTYTFNGGFNFFPPVSTS